VTDGMRSIFGDVLQIDVLNQAFSDTRPEIVIHMAAQALVRHSYNHPVETYATNVMGTVNVLEVIRECPSVRVAVIVTSDKCYENRGLVWGYRENEPLGGYDPYSSSKACAELVVSAYRRSFFMPGIAGGHPAAVASVRAGNVIGGGDWASDRLIPDMARAFIARQPVKVRSPKAVRPWQHVLEPLRGYLVLAERLWEHGGDLTEALNFGPETSGACEVGWIADQFAEMWGDGAQWITDGGSHPYEAHYLKLDCSKAKAVLAWTPKLGLRTALEWTVEWYKAYIDKTAMRSLSIDQIKRYEAMEEICT